MPHRINLRGCSFDDGELRELSEELLAQTVREAIRAALAPGAPMTRTEVAASLELTLRGLGFQARVLPGMG